MSKCLETCFMSIYFDFDIYTIFGKQIFFGQNTPKTTIMTAEREQDLIRVSRFSNLV